MMRAPWRTKHGPSRLALALTFGLLIGLLLWQQVIPLAPVWIDITAIVCAGLLLVRRVVSRRR